LIYGFFMVYDEFMTLTTKQENVLHKIKSFHEQFDRYPSYREMAESLGGLSLGAIQDHIKALVKKGCLEKEGRYFRLCSLIESKDCVDLAFLGTVAAGSLHEAFENPVESRKVAKDFLYSLGLTENDFSQVFSLVVEGESMLKAGILPGDEAYILKSSDCRSGDIVVASVDQQFTLKELKLPKKNGQPIVLKAHNEKYSDIVVENPESLQILGRLLAIQRNY